MQYSSIVRRLVAYRKQQHIPQKVLAERLEITQSQYSKMELGKTKLSYSVLHKLYRYGWDIDMIITGERSEPILPSLAHVFSENDLTQYIRGMKLCEWAVEQWVQKENKKEYIENRLMKVFFEEKEHQTALYKLRKATEMSQTKMAELVGVNIKKYCLLEKGFSELDAELIGNIYEKTNCKPVYFLDERAFYLSFVSKECRHERNRERQLGDLLLIKDKFE